MKKLLLVVVSLILICVIAVGLETFFFLTTSPDEFSRELIFEVRPGPVSRIAKELEEAGAITSAQNFVYYLRLLGKTNSVRIGEYQLNSSMKPYQVLNLLSSGTSVLHDVTFQEGLNIYEVSELLEDKGLGNKADFLRLCRSAEFIQSILGEKRDSLEGYLFPDTYRFTKYLGTKKIIQTMVERFKTAMNEVSISGSGMSQHEVVTLASIIEKETGAPGERRLISSVFHNRLNKKMRLQSDPTIIYGIADRTGEIITNIRKKHILEKNRYNTYSMKGLPVGPISNPGLKSLKAAVTPDQSEFFYFVSKNDGTHYFSKTYKEHLKAVSKFQLNAKARQGKSWRDLKKKSK